MPLGRRGRRPAQVLMQEASREPGSIFGRCPGAWDIFLTVGAGHAILAIAVGLAPGMLPHLRTSFSHAADGAAGGSRGGAGGFPAFRMAGST